MLNRPSKTIQTRLQNLEEHLKSENPVLVSVMQSFRDLDRIGYSMGLLNPDESFATQISWWPLISVLGTFSAGKSTFINDYLGVRLQSTGNQAVDDKFTVICFSREQETRQLPGLALDADPRFPFFQISTEIEKVASGEGRRVGAYLQLKTCPSEQLRGKILIDSPGFDADAQRTAILRITNHIIDLSDLVLVVFDARHPEPGAMEDTLAHLVRESVRRPDSSKFLYLLNQIDTAAREDNPEQVVGAWQRALAQEGLTAGRFYTIYSADAAVHIADDDVRKRFEAKRDHDLGEVHERMRQVSVERAYRIVGALEKAATDIEQRVAPHLRELISGWGRAVVWTDLAVFLLILMALVALSIWAGYWTGLQFSPPWWDAWTGSPLWMALTALAVLGSLIYLHAGVRKLVAGRIIRKLGRKMPHSPEGQRLLAAFRRNTRYWRSVFARQPVGWGQGSRKRLHRILDDAARYVQILNDRFTNPSGEEPQPPAAVAGDLEMSVETSPRADVMAPVRD